jgi:hypothetical protein
MSKLRKLYSSIAHNKLANDQEDAKVTREKIITISAAIICCAIIAVLAFCTFMAGRDPKIGSYMALPVCIVLFFTFTPLTVAFLIHTSKGLRIFATLFLISFTVLTIVRYGSYFPPANL